MRTFVPAPLQQISPLSLTSVEMCWVFKHNCIKFFCDILLCRDSSVGIATRCGLDGPGINSRCVPDFPHPSRPALGPTQTPTQWVPCLFPGVKRPGRVVAQPPPSRAEVKEIGELYLYSPSGPSWPVLGWIFILLPLYSCIGLLYSCCINM
jgi:hypothetical protein